MQISEEKSFSSITGDGYTDSDGRLLFTDLAEGEWWIRTDDGLVERQSVRNGALEILNIPYGHSIRVCEVRSPLGYIIGNVKSIGIGLGDRCSTCQRSNSFGIICNSDSSCIPHDT
ncbi:MAG: hypothetical protein EOM64_11070, partial [Erysipelotrichia bacterium]|nr:hypothetical protein [Erysipelotrichia bacterium]